MNNSPINSTINSTTVVELADASSLSILVKNLEPSITINWSKFRPKNEA